MLDGTKKRYEEKRVLKNISFNTSNQDDQRRLEFVDSVNFSIWVKEKIDEELTTKAQQ